MKILANKWGGTFFRIKPFRTDGHLMSSVRRITIALLVVGISACGGGGGSSAPAPPSTNPEGFYDGTATGSASSPFQLLVLEDGEYWVVHGNTLGGVLLVRAIIEGRGTSNNGSFSSTTGLDFVTSPPTPLTVTASYFTGQSVNGFFVYPTATVTFVGTPPSNFNYNTPALLTALADGV